MTPYRRQSTLPPPQHTQPVYFYKIIALTFLCLTVILLGLVVFMSSKRAIITIETKMSPVDVTSVVTVGNEDDLVSATVTSTILRVQKTFAPTGNKEEPGIATGVVTLHNETDADQPLVATTRLLSKDGVLFRLKDRVLVPARGTVLADVYADVSGASGNIAAQDRFTIPGLNEQKQPVIYASSNDAMTGGIKTIGILSPDDIEKAKKTISEFFLNAAKEQFVSLTDTTTVYMISDESFEVTGEVGTEVDGFSVTGLATVVIVNYDDVSLVSFAQDKLLSRAVDNTEIIHPQEELPVVTLSSYDAYNHTADLSVVYGGQAVLNPDSEKLEKSVFFGQTKDEVRRYLLTLDHVHGVEVKLSPAWIRSVPYVDDHVKVIVKKIQ